MGKEKEFITETTMHSCLLEHQFCVLKKKAISMNLAQLLKLPWQRHDNHGGLLYYPTQWSSYGEDLVQELLAYSVLLHLKKMFYCI